MDRFLMTLPICLQTSASEIQVAIGMFLCNYVKLFAQKTTLLNSDRATALFSYFLPLRSRHDLRDNMEKPIEGSIIRKLTQELQPSHIEVINESYMHNVPKGSETHFKVIVVADKFEGTPLIQRHRMVNTLLDEELKNGVHALSIEAKTPKQWKDSDQTIKPSPPCRGGFGK